MRKGNGRDYYKAHLNSCIHLLVDNKTVQYPSNIRDIWMRKRVHEQLLINYNLLIFVQNTFNINTVIIIKFNYLGKFISQHTCH